MYAGMYFIVSSFHLKLQGEDKYNSAFQIMYCLCCWTWQHVCVLTGLWKIEGLLDFRG